MIMNRLYSKIGVGIVFSALVCASTVEAQEAPATVNLTLDTLVDLTLANSYRIRYLDLDLEQARQNLIAQEAGLKSRVDLNVTVPRFTAESVQDYDDDLERFTTVRSESQRWDATLRVSQPVIIPFLGYPTNGNLALANEMYRRTQPGRGGGAPVTDFANEYSVQYNQPLFQPNALKNSLERQDMDFEQQEIRYAESMLQLVDEASNNYFNLFRNRHNQAADAEMIVYLTRAEGIAQELATANPAKQIELNQIRVELANALEEEERGESDYRRQTITLKTNLNLPQSTEILVDPAIRVVPVEIDMERALQYARELSPDFRELDMGLRRDEISLEENLGRGGFEMDLQLSYGREVAGVQWFNQLWTNPEQTYGITVNASLPIWDWGERDARLASARIGWERSQLEFEEQEIEIVSDLENEVRNVEERQARALTLQDNLALAADIVEESFELYRDQSIGVLDLLQSFQRYEDTAMNFVGAYISWRQSLMQMQRQTYWDFESDRPVMERWGIDLASFQ